MKKRESWSYFREQSKYYGWPFRHFYLETSHCGISHYITIFERRCKVGCSKFWWVFLIINTEREREYILIKNRWNMYFLIWPKKCQNMHVTCAKTYKHLLIFVKFVLLNYSEYNGLDFFLAKFRRANKYRWNIYKIFSVLKKISYKL